MKLVSKGWLAEEDPSIIPGTINVSAGVERTWIEADDPVAVEAGAAAEYEALTTVGSVTGGVNMGAAEVVPLPVTGTTCRRGFVLETGCGW
ncbi:MAG: hypothetical protein C0478_05820 [Planctomyces sp.]|nr:hypothetical protein [Planctomyces sp.]